jgi:hypothetical protein
MPPHSRLEKGNQMTTQYIAAKEELDAVEIMADILILKEAANVIQKWQAPNRVNAAAVAIIECDLMRSGLSDKLYHEHGIIAS